MVKIILTAGTTSWTVPDDCESLDSVECLGPGGNGISASAINLRGAAGGAGGAYARKNGPIAVTPGSLINAFVRAGGSDQTTWFLDTIFVLAQYGPTASGAGQATAFPASSSVGDVRFAGGNGGYLASGTNGNAHGGGGAAGPAGNGANASNGISAATSGAGAGGGANGGGAGAAPTSSAGGRGGAGPTGTLGGAGATALGGNGSAGSQGSGGGGARGRSTAGTAGNGGAGSHNNEFATGYGPGSGGGGGGRGSTNTSPTGGLGGNGSYGGGGGGGRVEGLGGDGLIVITYTPVGSGPSRRPSSYAFIID